MQVDRIHVKCTVVIIEWQGGDRCARFEAVCFLSELENREMLSRTEH